MNIFEITLDVDKRSNKESVNLRQGDINGTTIKATLRDHDVPMEGGDYTAAFCMTLPDRKTYYWTNATYENGVVSVVVDERVAAAIPGATNNAYFELYDGEELKYTTASFVVRIKASVMEGEPGKSYDIRVETLMDEMRETIDAVNLAEEGRTEAETLRVAAEDERATTFSDNEDERQATFGANELERQQTFDDNETQRTTEYTEAFDAWTDAETERAELFALNEQDRADAFSEGEAARQATFAANEQERQNIFDQFSTPTVSVEQTATGQVAHITWKDSNGTHVSDMSIDDAVNVAMTGDTFSIPVDPYGVCTESGTARFYFSGWVGNRMQPCTATVTLAADPRFSVRITNSTVREHGLIRVDYIAGTTYPAQLDVCTISLTCAGRTFLHRISAVAPRAGLPVDSISHESFEAFCNALSDVLDLIITETWNESTQQYEYTIVSGA